MQLTMRVAQILVTMARADRPVYGYELMQAMAMKSGALYPILRKLQDNGYVVFTMEENPDPDRPQRKYYSLTDAGHAFAEEAKVAQRAYYSLPD